MWPPGAFNAGAVGAAVAKGKAVKVGIAPEVPVAARVGELANVGMADGAPGRGAVDVAVRRGGKLQASSATTSENKPARKRP